MNLEIAFFEKKIIETTSIKIIKTFHLLTKKNILLGKR